MKNRIAENETITRYKPMAMTPIFADILKPHLRRWGIRDSWIGCIIGAPEELLYSLLLVSGLGKIFEAAGWCSELVSLIIASLISTTIFMLLHKKHYHRLAIRGALPDFFQEGVLVRMPMRPVYLKGLFAVVVALRVIYAICVVYLPVTYALNVIIGLILVMFLHGFVYNKLFATRYRLPCL